MCATATLILVLSHVGLRAAEDRRRDKAHHAPSPGNRTFRGMRYYTPNRSRSATSALRSHRRVISRRHRPSHRPECGPDRKSEPRRRSVESTSPESSDLVAESLPFPGPSTAWWPRPIPWHTAPNALNCTKSMVRLPLHASRRGLAAPSREAVGRSAMVFSCPSINGTIPVAHRTG